MPFAPTIIRSNVAVHGADAAPSTSSDRPGEPATDDEILGIAPPKRDLLRSKRRDVDETIPNELAMEAQLDVLAEDSKPDSNGKKSIEVADAEAKLDTATTAEHLLDVFEKNPELHQAWQDAQEYRQTFATPEEARAAGVLLADLNRMDALFFSSRPEDHAQLARMIAELDTQAFASLAHTMVQISPPTRARQLGVKVSNNGEGKGFAEAGPATSTPGVEGNDSHPEKSMTGKVPQNQPSSTHPNLTPAQAEFFHMTNAAAVQGVLDAIDSQVERVLPEGISKSARNRVVGEVYRELDSTLRNNRQLSQQVREAFRSGSMDAQHKRAIVSLITARARQALPAVARRVLNEWTSTIVAAGHQRRARQGAAERRVDIAGSRGVGNEGLRPISPRDLDYARMSDSDILNL